jgi:hypothetical protein
MSFGLGRIVTKIGMYLSLRPDGRQLTLPPARGTTTSSPTTRMR